MHKQHVFYKGMYVLKDLLSSIREDALCGEVISSRVTVMGKKYSNTREESCTDPRNNTLNPTPGLR